MIMEELQIVICPSGKAAHIDNLHYITKSCSVENMTDHLVKVAVVFLGVPKSEEDSLSGVENKNVLIKIVVVYTIYSSGDAVVECYARPSSNLPPLPCMGVEFHLDKLVDQIKWYGRGPFECYPDRKTAAHVGVYEQNVGDLHVPYIVPGECAGRADVRWVTFQNKDGLGILSKEMTLRCILITSTWGWLEMIVGLHVSTSI